jgi:hypothetical protein
VPLESRIRPLATVRYGRPKPPANTPSPTSRTRRVRALASSVTARADCTAARIRSVEDSPRVSQASMLLVTPLSPPPLCVRVFWLICGV